MLNIIIGIIIAHLVTFVVLEASKENEELAAIVGSAAILGPAVGVFFILKVIYRSYVNKAYIVVYSIAINEDGKDFINHAVRIKPKWFDDYYHRGENKYFIEKIDKPVNPSYENIRKVDQNGWWNQEWVNTNLLKKES